MVEVLTETKPRSPERSCVACRQQAPRQSLLRFVADQAGRLRVDPLQRAAGRGVYLCPDPNCLRAACQRGALAHGLRRKLVPIDAADLRTAALEAVRETARGETEQGLLDGRIRHRDGDASSVTIAGEATGTEGEALGGRAPSDNTVIDERLGRRLRILAEQARRLEAETVKDPKLVNGSDTEVRDP